MNIPGDDLFLLIKSLNTSEKRYFKLFADRQGSGKYKSYLKVFDLIDDQEDIYDEQLLKKKLKVKSEIESLPPRFDHEKYAALSFRKRYSPGGI